MNRIDRWRLAESLTVYQIALLMAGHDPSDVPVTADGRSPQEVWRDIEPYLMALQNAVSNDGIEIYKEDDQMMSMLFSKTPPNVTNIYLNVQSVKNWLKKNNFTDKFFSTKFQENTHPATDKESQFYSSKLNAALQAWDAVSSTPELRRGKSPKQALKKWLSDNAARLKLTKSDGSRNDDGIEEIAKVANWNPTGGAPSTPSCKISTPLPDSKK